MLIYKKIPSSVAMYSTWEEGRENFVLNDFLFRASFILSLNKPNSYATWKALHFRKSGVLEVLPSHEALQSYLNASHGSPFMEISQHRQKFKKTPNNKKQITPKPNSPPPPPPNPQKRYGNRKKHYDKSVTLK